MNQPLKKTYNAAFFLVLAIGCGVIFYQLKPTITLTHLGKRPTPTPTIDEQPQQLTAIEQATMSSDFAKEFEEHLRQLNAPPTPTLFFEATVPASMAGDLVPPTVTIQGELAEGAITTNTAVCFNLWVSDNMTPWQQLTTQAQLDDTQSSPWAPLTSYCYQNLQNGIHTFTVKIRDLRGNVSPETKRTFIVKR